MIKNHPKYSDCLKVFYETKKKKKEEKFKIKKKLLIYYTVEINSSTHDICFFLAFFYKKI